MYHLDLSQITHTVAFTHLPENTRTMDEIKEPVRIDQVVIGSCTNGRLSDMAEAAQILKGQHVAKGVRAIIIPATQEIYKQCIQLGYTEIFIDAGCVVSTPTCGPCPVSYTHLDVYKRQIYNPWSVLKYVLKLLQGNDVPESFWANPSGNDIIYK